MTDYDFRTLNDKEFEILVTDLLSKREGHKYERFKPGKDAGVDGRYFMPDGREAILQCKHWPSSPLEKLTRHLEEVELPKIKKLNPARYILALSHTLSRNDKTRILNILSPFVVSPTDILGREDLNDLLADNREVELRHYKLWITSTNVLCHLLNKPIHDRSAFVLQEIRENAHLYVPTTNHDKALEKLEQLGTVIITGPAGIGKTTLADHLALHYIAKGFSFIRISDEIGEAEAIFQTEGLQLFYFDDFLGRNYLEALTGHEGAHIVQFIKRISRDKRKRFILTSRSTILNQGKLLIDLFQTNHLERNEFEVSFESFSDMDKARILYNHIWHSSLESDHIDELYFNKRYRKIITHRNYNPRLVRYITDSDQLVDYPAKEYWRYAESLLDNPAKVWENPFEAQHDDFGRALILLVTLNSRSIPQGELAESYARIIAHPDAKAMHGRRDFLQSLRHLTGSMLSRVITSEREILVNLFNPSIGDFVLHRYSTDLPSLRAGFSSLRSISSLKTLFDLARNHLITNTEKINILKSILEHAMMSGYLGYSSEYIALGLVNLAANIDDLSPGGPWIDAAGEFVAQSECPAHFAEVAEIMQWRLEQGLSSHQEVADFVVAACRFGADALELPLLCKLVQTLPEDLAIELWPRIEDVAVDYFTNSVHDEFSDEDVFRHIDPDSEYEARRNLSNMIEDRLEDLGISASRPAIEQIIDSFDVSERSREYFGAQDDYDYREGQTFAGPQLDAIDDLFDRSR